ncbi:Six-hairpin glycosidase-like protein [Aspergillus pseudoustus]|uniref:Six-hairpin glycosidase-like protein n=1 Tax=Aspergillus pseudoustus TaxID=1810923 RepID=A0ABR4JTI0_9EURO
MAMDLSEYGSPWIWHPEWVDAQSDAAGGFVHFRKRFHLQQVPTTPVEIHITADTRYKLYLNGQLAHWGPVKGDERRWFYDTIDVQPFLRQGDNHVAVHVLRYFHATQYATSFARMPIGGLYIRTITPELDVGLDTNPTWETAIDAGSKIRADDPFDIFMHIFEQVDRQSDVHLTWVPAKVIGVLDEDWGITLPWKLCPRLIPRQKQQAIRFSKVQNISSSVNEAAWEQLISPSADCAGISLHPGTSHHIELVVENHTTALLAFRLGGNGAGSNIRVTYGECYEDEPVIFPFNRRKGDRCDTTKQIIGPSDHYTVGGVKAARFGYDTWESSQEVYQPFHYRTFRCIALDINVVASDHLTVLGLDAIKTNYPLLHKAAFSTGDEWVSKLWEISIRTLENCMHDCYEDCPFYEQLQYPMDTRSSSLFTYLVSGDDRLARQAIIQLHDTFLPSVGLCSSRSTSSAMQRQIIPAFSLYWICMVVDHYEYYADADFARQFTGVCDSILQTFSGRVDAQLGLVRAFNTVLWEYTDWTRSWAPGGVPPAVKRTGVSTYTNCLYAYTLKRLAWLLGFLDRKGLADEYTWRADSITTTVQKHCFDGEFFTDGLATEPVPNSDYSQHSQVWAILSGAAGPDISSHIMNYCLTHGDPWSQAPYDVLPDGQTPPNNDSPSERSFTQTSISFSLYTIRAMAAAGDTVYHAHFHKFWDLWKAQVAQNVSTWAEDSVVVRSDCHAWGSVPIHEFVTEVAGVKPAAPGWSTVSFKPRLQLFPQLHARVPLTGLQGSHIVEVEWCSMEDNNKHKYRHVRISLSAEDGVSVKPVSVVVMLPGREVETITLSGTASFDVLETSLSDVD